MKNNLIVLSIFLLVTVGAFAQKDQIKEAQSLYDKGKNEEALAVLKKTEYLIINASDSDKSDFFYLKGNICKDLAAKNIDAINNFAQASSAYQDVLLYENDSRNYKYAFKANLALKGMKSTLVDGAFSDYKAGKFKESAAKSYEVYLIDKKDTLNLFNAAGSSLNGKDYVSAIKYYEELRKINYTGKGMVYYAMNKKTKTEEAFISRSARESNIQAGLYEKPRDFLPPSKKEDILISLGYCYLERNDYVNAAKYYESDLQLNPNCLDCCINLAYVKMQLKKEILDQMNQLGNSPKEMKEYDKLSAQKDEIVKSAIPYLKKALTIEPKNEEATKTLLGVYRSLDMTNEYNALKNGM
ncbi:tetratricopeptide repeat protein [Flavobacterium johnsoniae]|jgi:tetratricopeptide (TPR) repeat protein|uniref:Uncharacterized protein n=2 Tax=Flavobacterium johnsoniae TaxID=986 RepID=A0A1M5NZY9_FLAJO|nr:hypothetical protein [Flavobacterium johnsoniae]ABQ05464.1 Tetratricopeptide TPR_2 repeat protein [Flavobacterium johnsoniae UW101]OXE96802.1 hypothetical protein B0A63_20080 [Flavobacterium johnsoniae UW101]WQG82733.1 hypothetical protein SR927_06345 [Flavobacterium johnsoniae UW101]SHG95037.1 hypothetical protein SAMN05444388_105184 [Flavobacterium johnsoniae]SHL56305.1 hypothetical protein SAMN05444146_4036 [Flavobacterium johnsoniae]